ncbi:MAG: NVEALA domain-containing protein [Bacteroidales bacterium]|jgi:hypothetical protein|nr:NVEALA domain-containing protein [Bacteroidales bacterium]
MKKMILSGIFVAAIALMAWNFYSSSHNEDLSELAKANIEALARPEKPTEPNFIGGDSGGQWITAYTALSYGSGVLKKWKNSNNNCEFKLMNGSEPNGTCWDAS